MLTVGVKGKTKPFVLRSGAIKGLDKKADVDGIDNLTRQSPELGKFAVADPPLADPFNNPNKDLLVLRTRPMFPDCISCPNCAVVRNPVLTVLAVC